MDTHDLAAQREFYIHDGDCSEKNFQPLEGSDLKRCLDCSGIFDKNGKGVAITDKRFD